MQLKLSNSSVKTLLRCEQKYTYKYVHSLTPKRISLPFKLGSWIHLLLEAKYKVGDWKPTQKRLSREYSKLWDEEKQFYGDLPAQTQTIMLGYEYMWKDDEDWDIIDTEHKLELELGPGWVYVAKLDVVAENDEGVWIWDHKSFKGKAPTDDYRTVDPQSALYDWAYERVEGVKPAGFIFNYIRTKVPAIPRLLKRGGLSRAKNIDTNWITLATTLKHYRLDPKDYREELAAARSRDRLFYDRVFIPKPVAVIKNLLADIKEKLPRIRQLHEGARPTRTLTRSCQYDCEYHLLCLTELVGGNGDYIRNHEFVVQEGFEAYDEPALIEES